MTDSELDAVEEVAQQRATKPNTGNMVQNCTNPKRHRPKPKLSIEEVRMRLRTAQSTYQTKKKRRA